MLAFLLKSVVLLLHLCGSGPAKLGRPVLLFVELLLTFQRRTSFLRLVDLLGSPHGPALA